MRVRKVLSLVVLVLISQSLIAQRMGTPVGGINEVRVRVVYDDDRSVTSPVSVQLLTGSGTPIQEEMSNDRGEVQFRSLPAGEYRVKVTGRGVKDTEAALFANEGGLMQLVRVEPKMGEPISLKGYVSARQLTIPEKAQKEFDKGARDLQDANLSGARKHFEKANELFPNYAAALNNLGVVAIQENDNAKAYDYFQKAVAADDTYVQALVNLGKIEMMNNNLKAALLPLERAKSLAPTDAQVFNMLAVAQIQLGDFDGALANARKVHQLEHEKYAISHYISANVLSRRGLREDAISEYELFLKEAKNSPTAKVAKAELKQLKNQALAAQ